MIERHREWGEPGPLAATAPSASDDASLARLVADGAGEVRPQGGDLARTLGVNEQSLARPAQMRLPVDLISIKLDDRPELIGAAHVVIGNARYRPDVAVMNAAFVRRRNVAPRAHPGDGKLDVVHFDLRLIDWFKALRRMPSGTHVPHPGITTRRVPTVLIEREQPVRVTIDHASTVRANRIECTLLPEAVVLGV